jgi:isopenicillin-N epimerase
MTDLILPTPSPMIEHFALDPEVVYLNHGSFGACPKIVLEAQRGYRDRVEADAMRFYIHDLWGLIDRSREALAPVVGAQAKDIVFVNNATGAVATVLDNLALGPGDELVVTSRAYQACRNNFERVADRCGAKVIVADLPWEGIDEDSIADAIMNKVTSRTKLVMVSLITSATAIRLPIERLIQELADRGIETLLDAAHGPGCVAMEVDQWGAAYTTGNAHKWLCNPKGCAFLHVREDLQVGFRPLVLSNDAHDLAPACERTKRSVFNHEFDYAGTDDRTAALTVVDSIAFLESLELAGFGTGIHAVMAHNRALCIEARDLLCSMFGTNSIVPNSMLGPLATIDIPAPGMDPKALRARLFDRYRIEAMIVPSPTGKYPMVRVSPQVYNAIEQYRYLGEAILDAVAVGM